MSSRCNILRPMSSIMNKPILSAFRGLYVSILHLILCSWTRNGLIEDNENECSVGVVFLLLLKLADEQFTDRQFEAHFIQERLCSDVLNWKNFFRDSAIHAVLIQGSRKYVNHDKDACIFTSRQIAGGGSVAHQCRSA